MGTSKEDELDHAPEYNNTSPLVRVRSVVANHKHVNVPLPPTFPLPFDHLAAILTPMQVAVHIPAILLANGQS